MSLKLGPKLSPSIKTPYRATYFRCLHSSARRWAESVSTPKTFDRHVFRGGQNISERYKRLENSLKSKEALEHDIDAMKRHPEELPADPGKDSAISPPQTSLVFHGFTVPEEPKPPSDEDCCMSGCAVCVYDLYEDSINAYKDALDSLRLNLKGANIPEHDWPESIQTKLHTQPKTNPALDAFQALEASIKQKKAEDSEPFIGIMPENVKARAKLARKTRRRAERRRALVETWQALRWFIFADR